MHRICAEETAPAPLGIMATDGTVVSGRLQSILRENGIKPVLPRDQASVMRLIYGVKQGKPLDIDAFHAETLALAAQGAENILLACTELSVYTETDIYNGASPPLYDALDLLARRCIKAVGGNVIDQRP
jgi:aspartate racemase